MSQQREVYATSSPPRTPPSQTAKYRPKRGYPARPSIRDAFPDAPVSMDNALRVSESGDERDPHDLSLSPNHAVRTSVVDNMLLSLDQFGTGPSPLDDYRLFNSAFETDAHGQYHGHTFTSSLSSDPDYGFEDGSDRYATIINKGRRSNSSSNYQTTPTRMSNARGQEMGGSRGGAGTMPRTNDVRNGRKGSSGAADYAYTVPRGRADSDGLDRRSASFDCGPKKAFIPYADHVPDQDALFYDDDAAPTPSIPAGPRKYQDYSRTPNAASSRTPVASRRNSVKSAHVPQVRQTRPENLGTGTLKPRDHEFAASEDTDIEPPVMPASLDPPAPSPTISYNKPAFPPPEPAATSTTTTITTNNTSSAAPPAPKERPGFFRRVFGSSKTSAPADSPSPNPNDLSYLQDSEPKDSTGATVNLKGRKQQQQQQPPKSPSVAHPSSTRDAHPQVVNKKPSFFRRRKKSVVDSVPPPIVLPQDLAPHVVQSMKPEPSPVSSLRKVMNPYLADGTLATEGAHGGDMHARDSASLQSQKPREIVSAPGGNSKAKQTLQPPSSSRSQDRSPLSKNLGVDDQPEKTGDMDAAESIDSAPQDHGPDIASATLSPVVEDFSRTIKVTTTTTTISDVTREALPGPGKLALPLDDTVPESPAASEASHYQTAANTPVIEPEEPKLAVDSTEGMDGPGDAVEDGPSATDREQAQKLFDSQDQVAGSDPAAAWLGEPDRTMVREAYMRLFNWSNLNILAALRSLCGRLVLKGESQQVDRVLDAFSNRWCDCNPSHGFKATGKFVNLVSIPAKNDHPN